MGGGGGMAAEEKKLRRFRVTKLKRENGKGGLP